MFHYQHCGFFSVTKLIKYVKVGRSTMRIYYIHISDIDLKDTNVYLFILMNYFLKEKNVRVLGGLVTTFV